MCGNVYSLVSNPTIYTKHFCSQNQNEIDNKFLRNSFKKVNFEKFL